MDFRGNSLYFILCSQIQRYWKVESICAHTFPRVKLSRKQFRPCGLAAFVFQIYIALLSILDSFAELIAANDVRKRKRSRQRNGENYIKRPHPFSHPEKGRNKKVAAETSRPKRKLPFYDIFIQRFQRFKNVCQERIWTVYSGPRK